jgi:hypothetical protein
MPKQKRSTGKTSKTGFVIGRAGFAKIGAVEGIRLKPAMKKRAAEASSKGQSAEEKRKAIIRSYRRSGDDPFATFSEWTSEADEKAYGGCRTRVGKRRASRRAHQNFRC